MEINGLQTTKAMDEYYEVLKNALIKAKKKETAAEKKMIRSGLFILTLLLSGVIYAVYLMRTAEYSSSYLSFILSDTLFMIWIASLFLSYYYFHEKTRKFEKAEKDYDELVEDIIDRSADIWSSHELKVAFFEELKRIHDINLYYK